MVFIDTRIDNGMNIIMFAIDKHRIIRRIEYGIKRDTPHKEQCKEDGNKAIPNLAHTLGLPFRPYDGRQCAKYQSYEHNGSNRFQTQSKAEPQGHQNVTHRSRSQLGLKNN